MPKSRDKTKGARKRKTTPTDSGANTESETSDCKSGTKKKNTKRRKCLEGIEMSKQLASQVKQKRARQVRKSAKKESEPRLCGNGKPMPSLAELEAMYADSDEDENPPQIPPEPVVSQVEPDRCDTPEIKPIVPNTINSPESLRKLTSKVIDILSKTIVLDDDDDGPLPPVIPQKKQKKSDTPYIVGCKERPQVPWQPKTKFGVDTQKYGVDPNQPPDKEEDKKRKKRGSKANISKSIFNAKSDEIAERLKELDSVPIASPNSPGSSSTQDYDYNSLRNQSNFSPLPSTSNDTDKIQENDRLFYNSLICDTEDMLGEMTPPASPNLPQLSPQVAQASPDEVEIVEVPCETVVIDDTFPEGNVKSEKRKSTEIYDDCCIILEPETKHKKTTDTIVREESPPKDVIYGSIDLTQTYDNEIYVINDDDIDDLIAENKAILEKDLKKNSIDCVTFVDPNVIVIESGNNSQQIQSTSSKLPNGPTAAANQASISNNSILVSHPPASTELECVEVLDQTSCVSTPPNQSSNYSSEVVVSNPPASTEVECVEVLDQTNCVTPSNRSSNYSSKAIAEVVKNFFTPSLSNNNSSRIINESNGTSTADVKNIPGQSMTSQLNESRGKNIVDVVGLPEIIRNKISSWLLTLDSCISDLRCHSSTQSPQATHSRHTTNLEKRVNQISENSIQCGLTTNRTTINPSSPSTSNTSQRSPPRRGLGDCPICMDNLANTAVASTICGHVFCMACIKTAIRANGKKCPTCRKALKGVGYHQLFL